MFPLKKEKDPYLNKPLHDKTNKMTCGPSEDSGQPEHPPSLISLHCPHDETLGPCLVLERTAKDLIRLGWAHMSFCSFCQALAHVKSEGLYGIKRLLYFGSQLGTLWVTKNPVSSCG